MDFHLNPQGIVEGDTTRYELCLLAYVLSSTGGTQLATLDRKRM
jgi:hypothetical protein